MISFAWYQPLAVMLSGLIYGFLKLCIHTKFIPFGTCYSAPPQEPKKGLAEKCLHLWLTALEKINIFRVCIFYYKTWTYSVKQHPFFFFFQLRLLAQCVKATLAEFPASFQICNFPCISRALFSAENICAENRLSERDHKEVLTRFWCWWWFQIFQTIIGKKARGFC